MLKSIATATVLALGALGAAHAQNSASTTLPRSPQDVPAAFERLFNAADIEGLTRLYAPGGVFVPAPGVSLKDPAAIKGALNQFLAAKLPMKVNVRQIYATEQTALIVADWVMEGNGPDGKPMKMTGTGADVVARQADGSWLYVIDNPMGVVQPAR